MTPGHEITLKISAKIYPGLSRVMGCLLGQAMPCGLLSFLSIHLILAAFIGCFMGPQAFSSLALFCLVLIGISGFYCLIQRFSFGVSISGSFGLLWESFFLALIISFIMTVIMACTCMLLMFMVGLYSPEVVSAILNVSYLLMGFLFYSFHCFGSKESYPKVDLDLIFSGSLIPFMGFLYLVHKAIIQVSVS